MLSALKLDIAVLADRFMALGIWSVTGAVAFMTIAIMLLSVKISMSMMEKKEF